MGKVSESGCGKRVVGAVSVQVRTPFEISFIQALQNLFGRFHLRNWNDAINSWMVILETTIVLLFILDVVFLVVER